jgi:hypothetical protein
MHATDLHPTHSVGGSLRRAFLASALLLLLVPSVNAFAAGGGGGGSSSSSNSSSSSSSSHSSSSSSSPSSSSSSSSSHSSGSSSSSSSSSHSSGSSSGGSSHPSGGSSSTAHNSSSNGQGGAPAATSHSGRVGAKGPGVETKPATAHPGVSTPNNGNRFAHPGQPDGRHQDHHDHNRPQVHLVVTPDDGESQSRFSRIGLGSCTISCNSNAAIRCTSPRGSCRTSGQVIACDGRMLSCDGSPIGAGMFLALDGAPMSLDSELPPN